MTKRVGNVVILEPEKPQQCDECGEVKELRPYGRDGAHICYECGQKNPRETFRNMCLLLWDHEPTEEDYRNMGLL